MTPTFVDIEWDTHLLIYRRTHTFVDVQRDTHIC